MAPSPAQPPWLRPVLVESALLTLVWLVVLVMAFVTALPAGVSWRTRAALFGQVASIGVAVISAWAVQRRLDRDQKARARAMVFATQGEITLAKTKKGRLYVVGAASRFDEQIPLIALGVAVVVLLANVIVVLATS